MTTSLPRRVAATAAAVALAAGLAACGSSSKGSSGSAGSSTSSSASGSSGSSSGKASGGTYTIWDPYPQFTNDTPWVKLLDRCGAQAGVKIKRTAFDTTDLVTKELLAAQQRNSPDVLVVDNPVVSTVASAGALTTTAQTGLSTSEVQSNLLAAGVIDGKTYGVPIGANTLALYYNKKILAKAGVNPASITNWATLTAALAKIKAVGDIPIALSAIGTEEGSFQFEPWFWGAGGNLTKLDSSAGDAALSLWQSWFKKGYIPNSALNDTQPDNWTTFAAGKTGFSENGTWELSAAQKAGFPFGIIKIPAENGGAAPVPMGGEFVTIPVQSNTKTYATSEKIVACLTKDQNAYTTDQTLSYVGATTAIQTKQAASTPALKPWIDAVHAARGRTADNLGVKYPKISQPLWGAIQSALSGSKSPAAAMSAAQSAASSATNGD